MGVKERVHEILLGSDEFVVHVGQLTLFRLFQFS